MHRRPRSDRGRRGDMTGVRGRSLGRTGDHGRGGSGGHQACQGRDRQRPAHPPPLGPAATGLRADRGWTGRQRQPRGRYRISHAGPVHTLDARRGDRSGRPTRALFIPHDHSVLAWRTMPRGLLKNYSAAVSTMPTRTGWFTRGAGGTSGGPERAPGQHATPPAGSPGGPWRLLCAPGRPGRRIPRRSCPCAGPARP